jgi:hypothetical protein
MLHKSMKTGSESGIPSKISLLKDLAAQASRVAHGVRPQAMKLSKNGVPCCYQTANSLCHYVSRLVGARQAEKAAGAGRRDREDPLQIMGERERVRARSFARWRKRGPSG